jgi:tripartite-type tricarboxylate transporter receptor subunit TctC
VELLNSIAGIKMTHVPYNGTGQTLIDLMAGQVQLTVANILSGLPYARSGRIRGLAVTGTRRVKAAPEIPTVNESDVPDHDVSSWNGWLAHAATPPEIIARLNAELVKTEKAPDIAERMAGDDGGPLGTTPD